MSLYAQIQGLGLVDLLSFKQEQRQREIPTFELTLPASELRGFDPYLNEIFVYRDGKLLTSGIVRTPQPVAMFGDKSLAPVTIRLKCDSFLGLLEAEESADLHFQNTLVSSAISQLLIATAGSLWSVGDTSTLDDIEITLDVRGAETLWSQIQDVVKASGNITFLRYGGRTNSGIHLLDIGYFRDYNDHTAIIGDNIIDPPVLNEPSREPIKIIRPISGSTADTPVNLDLALQIDPSLDDATQDYQILLNTGLVRNNTIVKGVRITKSYPAIKTENSDAPTLQEQQQAALALYRRCVAEFVGSRAQVAFSMMVALPEPPVLHDLIYVKAPVFERVIDEYTGVYEDTLAYNIDGYFRIVAWSASYAERKAFVDELTGEITQAELYEIEATSGDLEDETEITEILFNRLDDKSKFDSITSKTENAPFRFNVQQTLSTGLASDCTTGGIAGRTVTFTPPSTPIGATSVTFGVTGVLPSGAVYSITQAGGIGISAIVCVSGANGTNWTTLSSATISGVWQFS